MIHYFIAHRGNLDGPSKEENHPDLILSTISKGFEVEIDIRYIDNKLILGHDEPQYEVTLDWLLSIGHVSWCHAKNAQALPILIDNKFNCFFHDVDDCTLTSMGFIWTYPGKELVENSVAVMPELTNNWHDFSNCVGVCSDYIRKYML